METIVGILTAGLMIGFAVAAIYARKRIIQYNITHTHESNQGKMTHYAKYETSPDQYGRWLIQSGKDKQNKREAKQKKR